MIALRDIIEEYGLDAKAVAKEFFPEAKHPDLALARIMSYSLELDLRQISIIAKLAKCDSADLAVTLLTSNNKQYGNQH